MRRAGAEYRAWERELEEMERYLAAQREAFSSRDVARPPERRPTAPGELGPLPDDLRPRAEALLRATRAFEGEVTDARASVSAALRSVRRTRRSRAAYIDARA
jgi:hypothetical protein